MKSSQQKTSATSFGRPGEHDWASPGAGRNPSGELSGKRGAFEIVTTGAIAPDWKEVRIECTTHNCFDIAMLPGGCIGIEVLDAAPEVPGAVDRKLGGFRLQLELTPAGVFRF